MRATHSVAQPASPKARPEPAAPTPARPTETKPQRRSGWPFFASGNPAQDVVLPGADVAAPAKPFLGQQSKASRKVDVDPVVAQMMKPRQVTRVGTPLSGLHRAIATPIAKLFGVLGFAPGQLSIQSLTVTILAMATAADGALGHLILGGGLVYLGLLLDRADAILAESKGTPAPWTLFLGVVADRLVELCLIVGLTFLAVRGVEHPLSAWLVLPVGWLPILVITAGGTWLARRLVDQSAETLLLRTHLIATRRLPGPMTVARSAPARPFFGALFGRDEMIAVCALGIALGQLAVTAIVMVTAQAIGLVEAIVLFHLRLKEPEPEASRILGPGYP